MVKYGAIAAGAKAVGDVMTGIAEIKADEELTSARMNYSTGVSQIHANLLSINPEEDEFGNLQYDEEKIIKEEAQAVKLLQADIRTNMRYGTARRAFDKTLLRGGASTGSQTSTASGTTTSSSRFAAKVGSISAEVIESNVDNQIGGLLNADLFDAADERNAQALSNGAYGVTKFNEQRDVIRKRRTVNGAWDVINTPPSVVDKSDINEQLDVLEDPDFSDIEDPEKNALIGKLRTQLDTLDQVVEENRDDHYREVYNKLLPVAVSGQLPLSELIDSGIPPDDSLFQDLLGRVVAKDTEPKSLPLSLLEYRNKIRVIKSKSGIVDDWGKSVDSLIEEIRDINNGLNYTDQESLASELESTKKGVFGTELYKSLNRQVFHMVVGYEPGALEGMGDIYTASFNDILSIADESQQELQRKAELLGPGRQDELNKWVEDNGGIFRLRVNDRLFKGVGVSLDWDLAKDGLTAEIKLDIQRQMQKHLDANPSDLHKAKEVIKQVERLNGIKLLDP